jgi:predicted esterase
MRGRAAAVVLGTFVLAATPATAASLYTGQGPRPGPDLLYAKPKVAPQLTNRKPFRARPILVSGATAYRKGEFLYQDFLYDDHGARETADPSDPKAAGNLFSKPNGTYTYPTDPRYANNAADLVELRVRPAKRSTYFRLTLNTLRDRRLAAFTLAIGGKKKLRAFPHGANVKAPAVLFLTVRPQGKRLVAELVRASNGRRVRGRAPRVRVDVKRRQITVKVSHRQWNPHRHRVRLAGGVGLWDAAAGRYLLPRASADATHPGGAGTAGAPAAFFNVAFRTHEPSQRVTEGQAVVLDAAWWRDRAQGHALAAHDISPFHANVSFRTLARRKTSNRGVPKRGPMDRILSARKELGNGGADFSESCLTASAHCVGQYRGRLQPYAIYIPKKRKRPKAGWGMTLQLHSLSAPYNQYYGSRNQSQFGERGGGSIVITPEARGPDENYENNGAADVFEVWADVARRYRLDPAWTVITGYSMGGDGTFLLGSQFPDLFARAQPTVGFEQKTGVLSSLRNVPVLMWNTHGDELINDAFYNGTAAKLDSLGYRYELHAHQPCANPNCSPLFPNHNMLAINDQYAPAADFLGGAKVDRNPPHVTMGIETSRDHPELGLVADHAYWVSGVRLRSGTSGQFDALSHGFGVGDPVPSPVTQVGSGTLTGGNLGPLLYERRSKTWGPAPPAAKLDQVDVKATNVRSAAIHVGRARVSCNVRVNIASDGPIDVALPGCNRTVHSDGNGGLPIALP